MASTLDRKKGPKRANENEKPRVAALVERRELEAAQRDSRVRDFLAEADAYVARLDSEGRNR